MPMNSQARDPVTSTRRKIILAATGVAGALVLAAGVCWVAAPRRAQGFAMDLSTNLPDTPAHCDRANRGEFVAIKSEGDALAMDGEVQAAYDAYQRCATLVADHELTDPVVICTVKSAQENQTRLMLQMADAENKPLHAATVGRDAGSVASASSPSIVPATLARPLVKPLDDNRLSNDRATTDPVNQPGAVAGNPDHRGSEKLFGGAAPAPKIVRQSGGTLATNLDPDSNLGGSSLGDSNVPSMFRPFDGSEPGQSDQPVVPVITVQRKPVDQPVAAGVKPGTPTQTVYVEVKARAPGSPPVTGTVDGQPFSIGAGGAAGIEAFITPVQSIPVSIDGQNYTFNGTTMSFAVPSGNASPPRSAPPSSVHAVPTMPFGVVRPKPKSSGATSGGSNSKGTRLQSAY
jgi:hypothetical protein